MYSDLLRSCWSSICRMLPQLGGRFGFEAAADQLAGVFAGEDAVAAAQLHLGLAVGIQHRELAGQQAAVLELAFAGPLEVAQVDLDRGSFAVGAAEDAV